MTDHPLLAEAGTAATPIHIVEPGSLDSLVPDLPPHAAAWIEGRGFKADPGKHLLLPGAQGEIAAVVAGQPNPADPFSRLSLGLLARSLPAGTYALANQPADPTGALLGWLLGAYRFDRYLDRTDGPEPARLVVPEGADRDRAIQAARACSLACDLVNTPANDLTPSALAAAADDLAQEHDASFTVAVGDALLDTGLPLIHAVGRAAAEPPRLADLSWGDPAHPKVTLVGKGVTFDTGGVDLKPRAAMLLMKKDMGGAANVLGLASMIMAARLPVRLRVLLPIVENSVSGASFRPGDVFPSRKGISVEIGDTDAEGRLILADALTLADEEEPDLLIDMATLTGAARAALGPDLPPLYTHDDEAAAAIIRHAEREADPLWRMPLWQPYDGWLRGQVADITNSPDKAFAGSIIAALFLDRFVERAGTHVHLDIYAWSPETRAHAMRGGAAQGIRALFAYVAERFGS